MCGVYLLRVKICQKRSFSRQVRSTESSLLSNLCSYSVQGRGGKVEMDIKLGKYRAMPTGDFESRKVVGIITF